MNPRPDCLWFLALDFDVCADAVSVLNQQYTFSVLLTNSAIPCLFVVVFFVIVVFFSFVCFCLFLFLSANAC